MNLDLSKVPADLANRAQWVAWQLLQRYDKPTKVPINAHTGGPASTADRSTWSTLTDAVEAFTTRSLDGVGFVFAGDDPYTGIDLDDCRNSETGEIAVWAREIIDKLCSYTEVSPSGKGVKIWVKAKLLDGARNRTKYHAGEVEIYSRARYFAVTGGHLEGTPRTVEPRQVELSELHARLFPLLPRSKANAAVCPAASLSISDADLIDRARSAKNGAKFSRLWAGDTSDFDDDESRADLALCCELAFWTGRDQARVDSLFRLSGLMREKWNREDYREQTITRAIANTDEIWNPRHGHGNGIARQEGDRPAGGDGRPRIRVNGRELPEVARDSLRALQSSATPLHLRSGRFVRISYDENGKPSITGVSGPALRGEMARAAVYYKFSVKKEGDKETPVETEVSPPRDAVEDLLSREITGMRTDLGLSESELPFPALDAVVESPILRMDGTVLSTPGYDAPSHVFFALPKGATVPQIPDKPITDDVVEARDLVLEMLADFPFANQSSLANAFGLALTPIVRRTISGTVPMALVNAPQQGTGKTLLAKILMLAATGRLPAMKPAPHEETEWQKLISAILSVGSPATIFDNVEHKLVSASLALVLTAKEWEDRKLGVNTELLRLPNVCTWIATGNNLSLGGDIPRRCFEIRLDAKVSRPWERGKFRHPDLMGWVVENQTRIQAALLTIARAWFAAGQPVPAKDAKVIGGFDSWSHVIGGILDYACVEGFLGNLDETYEFADEDGPQWEGFLEAIADVYGVGSSFTVKDLVPRLASNSQLKESLPDIFEDSKSLERRIGRAFSKRVGTRYGKDQWHLERAGKKKSAAVWLVNRQLEKG